MAATKPKKAPSGGAKLKAAGKRPVLLGLTPDQHARLTQAAQADGRPLTQFITHHILAFAETFLKKVAKGA